MMENKMKKLQGLITTPAAITITNIAAVKERVLKVARLNAMPDDYRGVLGLSKGGLW
jgi:hypothetical protein